MTTIDQARLGLMHRYWNAANYLTIGQIYLQENPLLKEPLRPEHIKPRLLGHWGTSPGLNFIYVHLDRAACQMAGRGDQITLAQVSRLPEHPADLDLLAQRPQRF